jgi:hypothetical protein
MAFKLIEAGEHRWRAVSSAHLVALVRAGAEFEDGASSSNDLTSRQAVALTLHDPLTHAA